LDELQALVQHQIPYEIIPGITAALGAAAYTGIPLTARNYATAVRFLTCYDANVITEDYWKELATTNDTLVFYMSAETSVHVADKLTANGIHSEKLIAVIEQATTPLQVIHTCNLYEFAEKLGNTQFKSPSLVIIGKVVALHEQFKWLKNSTCNEDYFQPVVERIIAYEIAERA
jgi:uroporphyrin-III C-methyltransferase/precorrin-2 dehydrogenase/sirohydrochlorin ferrochelatase/uroporphyrin-III C-methyltransferase